MGDCTSRDESAPLHDVPVNTLHVHELVRLIGDLYDSTVISCNTPISTSVNESTGHLRMVVSGDTIDAICHFDQVDDAINVHIRWGRGSACTFHFIRSTNNTFDLVT
jgi:hypothetical protein